MPSSASSPSQPPRVGAAVLVRGLDVGDWRRVLEPPASVELTDGSHDATGLVVLIRLVALSMQSQAGGHVVEAWRLLTEAASLLPALLSRRSAHADIRLAVLTPPPPANAPDVLLLTWKVSRVIWREQQEIQDVRGRFARGRLSPRSELVDACIEYLRWVECDPWWIHGFADGAADGLRSRRDLCVRASRLRKFATPTAGDLGVAVWRGVGEFRSLYGAALERLAGSDVVPWWSENPMVRGVPVRRGRVRAHDLATRWRADLQYW